MTTIQDRHLPPASLYTVLNLFDMTTIQDHLLIEPRRRQVLNLFDMTTIQDGWHARELDC